jgi:uncharacterized protein (DUF2147 family)
MKNRIFFKTLAALFMGVSLSSFAQMTPVGTWQTVDDNTNEVRAEIQIVEQNGVLSGRIKKSFNKDTTESTLCEECKDDRKNQPILGLEIVRGVKREGADNLWAGGGKILDPENGKEYTVRMVPQEEGKKLRVRGYIGPFYRTQVWIRTQ